MGKIAIKTSKKNRQNLTCIIAGISVAFNENYEAVVDESELKQILAVDQSISYEGMPKVEEVVVTEKSAFESELDAAANNSTAEKLEDAQAENAAAKAEDASIASEENKTEEDVITENTEINFDDLTKAALQDVAKEAGFDSSEWKNLKKEDLIVYLKQKM